MESPRGFNDPRLGNIKSMISLADLIIVIGKPVDFTLSYGSLEVFKQDTEWFVYIGCEELLKKARSNLGNRLKEGKNTAPLAAIDMFEKLELKKAAASEWLLLCVKPLTAVIFLFQISRATKINLIFDFCTHDK